ncbi:MAG: hypothetical protein BGN85_05320 [Alphaproteobacteria bacterium 64-11]|nr:DUF1109 domain-containing protein [Alphaproteobacteria bacterium]OJU11406.1 MAG: hypothetical protein BGN85_05320 [Alphaproteobacteria bacterium 64-11]
MQTDELIALLSEGLEPVRPGTLARQTALGVGVGLVLSTILMLTWLGLRPDFDSAMVSFGMWMKLAYAFALAAFALWALERLGRPGSDARRPLLMLALPVGAILVLSAIQMMAPDADRTALVMGHSSDVCATNILGCSLPLLAAAFWILRRMAPTSLGLTGAVAGLFAGGAGAFVYAFHCTEATAPFVLVWYTLGVGLTALTGAILGRWLLRW